MTVAEAVYDVKQRLKKNSDDSTVSDRHVKYLIGNIHAQAMYAKYKSNSALSSSAYKKVILKGVEGSKVYDVLGRVTELKFTLPYKVLDLPNDGGYYLTFPSGFEKVNGRSELELMKGNMFFKPCKAYFREGSSGLIFSEEFEDDSELIIMVMPHVSSLSMTDEMVGSTEVINMVIDEVTKRLERSEKYLEDELNDGKEKE